MDNIGKYQKRPYCYGAQQRENILFQEKQIIYVNVHCPMSVLRLGKKETKEVNQIYAQSQELEQFLQWVIL